MTPENEQKLAHTLQLLGGEVLRLRSQQQAMLGLLLSLAGKHGASPDVVLRMMKAHSGKALETFLLELGDRNPFGAELLDIYKLLERDNKPASDKKPNASAGAV